MNYTEMKSALMEIISDERVPLDHPLEVQRRKEGIELLNSFIEHQKKSLIELLFIAPNNPLKDPVNHPLWVLLNEIKRGRPAAEQVYLQFLIDQLRIIDNKYKQENK